MWSAIAGLLAKIGTFFVTLFVAKRSGVNAQKAKQAEKEKGHAEEVAKVDSATEYVDNPADRL